MYKFSKFLTVFVIALSFYGCSTKGDGELYNLTPDTWYSQILRDINDADMKSADKHYISFSSEHIASPLLEEMTLIMAQAYVEEEDYTNANRYLDEYIRRYGTYEKIEYARFLKIKANFDSFSKPNRNQRLLLNSIGDINQFLTNYPTSKYKPLLQTMKAKLSLATHQLDRDIQSLYERTGRDESAQIYQKRVEESPLKSTEIIRPRLPWYRAIFE